VFVTVALRSSMVAALSNATRTRLVICTRAPMLKTAASACCLVRVPSSLTWASLDVALACVSLSRAVTSL
jgi:hypothetical protein